MAKAAAKRAPAARRSANAAPGLTIPFHATLGGTEHETSLDNGLVAVTLDLDLTGRSNGRLGVRIVGQPLAGGGVSMQESRVTLGSTGDPGAYAGRIDSLSGQQLTASLTGRDGRAVQLRASFQIDPRAGTVSGDVVGARAAEGVG